MWNCLEEFKTLLTLLLVKIKVLSVYLFSEMIDKSQNQFLCVKKFGRTLKKPVVIDNVLRTGLI